MANIKFFIVHVSQCLTNHVAIYVATFFIAMFFIALIFNGKQIMKNSVAVFHSCVFQ